MGIGTGILLLVLGLILLTGVIQVDLPWIEDYSLGWILVIGGIVALAVTLIVGRRRTTIVERDVEL